MKSKKLLFIFIPILVIFLACAVYVNDYYHATTPMESVTMNTSTYTCHTLEDKTLVFEPKDPKAGLIFYPGGKVEYTAYAPLMQQLADQGILCMLVKMPMNLAVLDPDAANGLQALYPNIKDWYIGGHSLGGSMAASYVAKNADTFDGLVLLAAYSTIDLSKTDLNVLSIYGSNDGVLNFEKYKEYKDNLPSSTLEYTIEGGCHAYFGSYGPQDGDGTPTLTNEEQIDLTADFIAENILQN